ncbi:3'-5' exonuclease [Alysiella filiformis]|uniref:DNA polymerase-3 subunit epsilon n=1 Tax=Alysiella filiformis DSM 16848 TaxID=1120981 RepID=A0A286EF36_9NEIS|nr:3'-5' exonuclease [Alysiella filiformis]QMT31831.1 3'-5' exonuclease [Alysiella filiformis]UBQ57265.1 3'-5' exonuclease [Alysiella filiformis DSM 16848]SOD69469.1 DNA polymerase-3 subunit epsilon [Alysiella filiformis DSM 16848]
MGIFAKIQRHFAQKHLTDPHYQFLFDEHAYPNEYVSFDCETTSLDVKEAEIISIGAVKIRGNQIMTSESFYVLVKPEGMMEARNVTIHGLRPKDLSHGLPIEQALQQFLAFVGGRPVVGYFLEYDVAMVNKFMKPMLGIHLPNRQIEVSALYYQQEMRQKYYDMVVDLRMASMINKLKIPDLPRHDALNDAINVAMMFLALQGQSQHK